MSHSLTMSRCFSTDFGGDNLNVSELSGNCSGTHFRRSYRVYRQDPERNDRWLASQFAISTTKCLVQTHAPGTDTRRGSMDCRTQCTGNVFRCGNRSGIAQWCRDHADWQAATSAAFSNKKVMVNEASSHPALVVRGFVCPAGNIVKRFVVDQESSRMLIRNCPGPPLFCMYHRLIDNTSEQASE